MTKTIVLLESHFNLYFTEGGLISGPWAPQIYLKELLSKTLQNLKRKKVIRLFSLEYCSN